MKDGLQAGESYLYGDSFFSQVSRRFALLEACIDQLKYEYFLLFFQIHVELHFSLI